jgi:hypothetical protein
MGEARRRKAAGWVPALVRLECFIAQSMVSDAHSVYLGIGRGQEVELRRMESFASIVDAWESLCRSKKVLQKFKYHHTQGNNEITRNFIRLKHDTFGVFPNDDANYELSGDKSAMTLALEWISEGNNPFSGELPPGVQIKIINPPVQKKYKVFSFKVENEPVKNYCGNPEDTHNFCVGISSTELIIVEDTEIPMYTSYISAAYTADYLNTRNQDFLSWEESRRLLYEANRLQGKI